MVKVTENWASTLRAMKVGDIVVFPVRAISSVNTTISRLRLEMCVENADWKRTGERNNKVFTPVKAERVTFKAEWSDCYNSNSRGYLGSQYCGD